MRWRLAGELIGILLRTNLVKLQSLNINCCVTIASVNGSHFVYYPVNFKQIDVTRH